MTETTLETLVGFGGTSTAFDAHSARRIGGRPTRLPPMRIAGRKNESLLSIQASAYLSDMRIRLKSISEDLDFEAGKALAEEVRLAVSLRVADAAVHVLHLLLSESLRVRQREWTRRAGTADGMGIAEIRMMIRPGLRRLLCTAADSARERNSTEILAVDVARALSVEWCGIWPFCGPDKGSVRLHS